MTLFKRFPLSFVILFFPAIALAQPNVSVVTNLTVEELVNQYLLGGGVEATNITFNGQPGNQVYIQAGLYEGPSNVVSFDQGVVLATSSIQHIVTGMEDGAPGISDDPDLMAISGEDINNAAILEFDFVVSADSVKFNYVFASDEYPGYTCSSFNDAFGFFISGPGISGPFQNNAKNIALIPGTDTPVAINTVNSGVATGGDPSNCAQANPNWQTDSELYFQDNNPPANNDVQYPGMTVTMTAMEAVQCGGLYHIKMAIGNASDQALQSGVFLEAGSFDAFGEIFVNFNPVFNEGGAVNQSGFDSVLVAGCTAPNFQITRPSGATIDGMTFGYGGTAIEGIDFVFDGEFPTTFPDGVDTINFVINTINPNITDTIYFELYVIYETCSEIDTIVTIIPIIPPPEIIVTTENGEYFCPIDSVVVEAQASNALEPYSYNWVGYGEGQGILVPIPDDEQYFVVEVMDACEFRTTIDSVLVTNSIPPPLTVSIDPFQDPTCPSETLDLHVTATGGLGEYAISWQDNQGNTWGQGLPDVETPPYIFPPDIYVQVVDECGTTVGDTITINVPQYEDITAQITPLSDHCPVGSVELKADIQGGAGDKLVIWNIVENEGVFADGSGPNDNPSYFIPEPGMNRVTFEVTDGCHRQFLFGDYSGIYKNDSLNLPVIDLSALPNVITPNKDRKNDAFVVRGVDMFDDARVEFYDRWGRLVYETDNYRAGAADPVPQDAFTAKDLEDGTYFYIINVNSGECKQSGYLEVLRGDM